MNVNSSTTTNINDTVGVHGTSWNRALAIEKTGFEESKGEQHWLGKGVYFFVDGVNREKTVELAKLWAIDAAWDNLSKKKSYFVYAVLEVIICVEEGKLIDLTDSIDIKTFNSYRDVVIEKLRSEGWDFRERENIDWFVIEHMKKNLGLEFVKGNLYIKFDRRKTFNIESRVANCTCLVVSNPSNNINMNSVKVVERGNF